MKKKGSIRAFFATITLVNLILVGGSVYLVIYLKNIQQELITLEQTTKDQEAKTGSLFKLKNLIEETTQERAQLDAYFIEGETETVQLLEEIEEISDTLGVPITFNINTETASFNETAQDVLRLSVDTKGTFVQMNQLLTLFENLQYKTVIDGISLRRAEARTVPGTVPLWNMSFILRVVSFVK